MEAQQWCDKMENKDELAQIIGKRQWFNVPPADINARIKGDIDYGDGRNIKGSDQLMNAITPVSSIIPETAPFSTEQRAWLNGFFAAYLGVSGEVAGHTDAAAEPDEDFPWHDASLAMPERLELAKGAKPERQLMAAMIRFTSPSMRRAVSSA